MRLQSFGCTLGNHESVPGWAYGIIPFIKGFRSSDWVISWCNVVTWSWLTSKKCLAQSYSGQNGPIRKSDEITWLTTQHPETVWSSMHLSESIQVCFEDRQVICSSTALRNRFLCLTTPSRKWISLFVLCKLIHIYRNYIYTYIYKNIWKMLFIYLLI